jgi:hypothetical protein
MMRKWTLFLLIAASAFALYWFGFRKSDHKPKQPTMEPIKLSRHTAAFNQSVNDVVAHYLKLKDAFVEPDTAAIRIHTNSLLQSLAAIDSAELNKDTTLVFATVMQTIADIRMNATSLLNQTDITEMRRDFSSLSSIMYPGFFKAILYEGPTLYLINCPMAFNENEPANWISNSREIINPYLGKNHPKYHGGMLHCGEVKDSIIAQ